MSTLILSSISDLSFLLQCLGPPLNQAVQTAELMLKLKHLSLVSIVCGLLLHLQATAGTTNNKTLNNAGQQGLTALMCLYEQCTFLNIFQI